MSIKCVLDDGWLISHLEYINNMYKEVKYNDKTVSLKFSDNFFKINSKYQRQSQIESKKTDDEKRDRSKKRKRMDDDLPADFLKQVEYVKNKYDTMKEQLILKDCFDKNVKFDNNEVSRLESINFYLQETLDTIKFKGENAEDAAINNVNNKEFVFPKKCRFYNYDVEEIDKILASKFTYDLIVLDPPWYNKSIKRKMSKCVKTSYKMMSNESISNIPINKLLSNEGLVAVWCTLSSNLLKSPIEDIFPKWGVKHKATWYWLKITQKGETICEFSETHGKQPYELLILGSRITETVEIPDGKILMSVPSSAHSHKPPLTEIIAPYIKKDANCLEIFARYLLSNWTSFGLEVLKFQSLSSYIIDETLNI